MDFVSVVFLTLIILVSFILGFKITYHIVNREFVAALRERALNEKRMVRDIELMTQGYLKTDNDKLTKEDEAK